MQYSLVEAHRQSLRDFAFFVAILVTAAAIWSLASKQLRSRVTTAERATHYASTRDRLTGLFNRRAFEAAAQSALENTDTESRDSVLLYVDLNGFKEVNDNYGHHTGDIVLKEAAARFGHTLDQGDLLGRLGGDEFGILLNQPADRGLAARRAAALMAALVEPINAQGHAITIGLSIGAVVLDRSLDFQEALRRADVALFEAKRNVTQPMVYFSEAMDASARLRYRIQHELKEAIESGQFFLEYQPQVDGSGTLKGVEALVRWHHPTRGLVRPDEFIAIAEQSGQIVGIGRIVVELACRDLVHVRRSGIQLPYISVNVSPKQLAESSFFAEVMAILAQYDLCASDLELEVTESSLMESRGEEEEVVRHLAKRGFRIAIDDFGTGYSSLSRLHTMPVDKLKIDRSFIKPLPGTKADRAIPESILLLAKKLGLKTVAEGVETLEQAEWLQAAGCALMQGYYFARPMPLDRLLKWIASNALVEAQSNWADTRGFAEV